MVKAEQVLCLKWRKNKSKIFFPFFNPTPKRTEQNLVNNENIKGCPKNNFGQKWTNQHHSKLPEMMRRLVKNDFGFLENLI